MRLPIEDNWRPDLVNNTGSVSEHLVHVRALAERLREANEAAGLQSKISHETPKRYYDRQTKLEKFKKRDFVYVHDPTYKRGKARKFSYRYKGPFEIVQKIFPLF